MRIILTDCDHAAIEEEQLEFRKANMKFTRLCCKTEKDLIEQCKGGEVFINQYAPFTKKVMSSLRPELKMIVRYGVGVDNIDCAAASELGVQVCNVPDYGMNEVADQAVALLMALTRKICLMNECTKRGVWEYSLAAPIRRIPGSTVGIVGIGRIGKIFARRIRGFDVKLIAYDPRFQIGETVDGIELVPFETLLRTADMISIHCPLNDTSRNMFNNEAFSKMKPAAYLVNTSRGHIVNENDLYAALKEGRLAGAALDVTAREPIDPKSGLLSLSNFLCTPHIAWYSLEASSELKRKAAQEAIRFAKGERVLYPVNTPQ